MLKCSCDQFICCEAKSVHGKYLAQECIFNTINWQHVIATTALSIQTVRFWPRPLCVTHFHTSNNPSFTGTVCHFRELTFFLQVPWAKGIAAGVCKGRWQVASIRHMFWLGGNGMSDFVITWTNKFYTAAYFAVSQPTENCKQWMKTAALSGTQKEEHNSVTGSNTEKQ